MNSEEKYIRSRMSDKNPFKVPDGYFDSLVPQVMSRIPQQSAPVMPKARVISLADRLRPLLYAAAGVFVAVFCLTVYFDQDHAADEQSLMAVQSASSAESDAYFDEVADYMMMDSYEMYACLTND